MTDPRPSASVLLVSEVFPPRNGGSGRWMWELYRRLPFAVTVLTDTVARADAFDGRAGLTIVRMPLSFPSWGVFDARGLWTYVRTFGRLRRLVRRLRPRELHCGKALPEGLLALGCRAWFGLPYVCFTHGEELRLARTSRDLRWLTTRVLRNAKLVIANSENTATMLRDEWHISRVTVMHPGVDAARFTPACRDEAVRQRLGWSGRQVVLTVGTLQQRKGQDMMIRALPAVRAAFPGVLYVAAGDGTDRADLQRLADETGVGDLVQFPGSPAEDQLVDYYRQCDLFVLPNRQVGWDVEGFGIVLLEAQACGVAVIAGRSGGTSEALRPGLTGELVPCEAPEPLAAAVIALLEDAPRRRAMGSAGREWVAGTFDWSVLARQATEAFAASPSLQ